MSPNTHQQQMMTPQNVAKVHTTLEVHSDSLTAVVFSSCNIRFFFELNFYLNNTNKFSL